MQTLFKFLATTVGRDKIHRFLQYYSKFLLSFQFDKETLDKLQKLQSICQMTRKTSRLGRTVEFWDLAYHDKQLDSVPRLLTQGKNVMMGSWLIFDTLQWLSALGFKFENIKQINERAYRCWFYALVCSLLANVYKFRWNTIKLGKEQQFQKRLQGKKDILPQQQSVLRKERQQLLWNITSDALDLLIPGAALGWNISPRYVGLAGATTAVMGA
ncbi:peroxisomal biogenesis factor 11, partial [Gorgonomyces haynaldii]